MKRNGDNARTRGNRHWNVDCGHTKLKIDSTNTFCVNFLCSECGIQFLI